MNLCKYSNIFGEVGKGAHKYRIWNIAIVDVVATIFVSGLLYFLFGQNIPFLYILVGMFILGIILHRLFCVRTTIDKILFS